MDDNDFINAGHKTCSTLSVILNSEGLLGGPHLLKVDYPFDGIEINIEIKQCVVRIVQLFSATPIAMSQLWSIYIQIEQLLMLFDGRFCNIENVIFAGDALSENEYATNANECLLRRLSYCKTDPVYLYTDHCFLAFDMFFTPDLLSKWFVLHEELGIVHQIVLYNIADTGIVHEVKCANLIECFEPLTELISAYDIFFRI